MNAVSCCSLSETLNMKILLDFQLFIAVSSLLPPTYPGAVGGKRVMHDSCEDQWRTQEFCSGGEGGQQIQLRTERMGIWGQ